MDPPGAFLRAHRLTSKAAVLDDPALRRRALRVAERLVERSGDSWSFANRGQVRLGLAGDAGDVALMKGARGDFRRAILQGCPLAAPRLGYAMATQWLGDMRGSAELLREAIAALRDFREPTGLPLGTLQEVVFLEGFAWEHLALLGEPGAAERARAAFEQGRGVLPDRGLFERMAPVVRGRRGRRSGGDGAG